MLVQVTKDVSGNMKIKTKSKNIHSKKRRGAVSNPLVGGTGFSLCVLKRTHVCHMQVHSKRADMSALFQFS